MPLYKFVKCQSVTVAVAKVSLPIYIFVSFKKVDTPFLRMKWHIDAATQHKFAGLQKSENFRIICQAGWNTDLEDASRPQKPRKSIRPSNLGFVELELKRTSRFHNMGNLLDFASIPILFSLPVAHSSQATAFVFNNRKLLSIIFKPFGRI